MKMTPVGDLNFIADRELKVAPALCMDLDGTTRINKSGKPFIEDINDIEIRPGLEEIFWRYKGKGFMILAFSNQGGVAHGFKTVDDVIKENQRTMELFSKNPFDYIYCCHHDEQGNVVPYNHRSLLRKPNIGMLAVAEVQLFSQGIITDWNNSFFVGDRPEDVACAYNADVMYCDINDFLKNNGDIQLQRRWCPECKKNTPQKSSLFNPDIPEEGEVWECSRCHENTGWTPLLNI